MDTDTDTKLHRYDMSNPRRRKQLHYQAMLETRDLLRQILNVVVENRLGARPEDDDTNGEAQPMKVDNRTFADVVRERDVARGLADEMAKVADKAMADAKEQRATVEKLTGVIRTLKDSRDEMRERVKKVEADNAKLEADRDSWKQEAHLQRDRANKAASTDPDAAEQIEALKLALEEVKRQPTNVPAVVRQMAKLASQCVNITNEHSPEPIGRQDAAKRLFADYITGGQVDALARLHFDLPEA